MAGILDHKIQTFTALDFFAGSGLVTHSLKHFLMSYGRMMSASRKRKFMLTIMVPVIFN